MYKLTGEENYHFTSHGSVVVVGDFSSVEVENLVTARAYMVNLISRRQL